MADLINYTAFQTILNWFKTGKKPTQQQFWDSWASFWHKSEQIPIAKIAGVQNIYDSINALNDNLQENYVPYSGSNSTVDLFGQNLAFDEIVLNENGVLRNQTLQNAWPTTPGKLATEAVVSTTKSGLMTSAEHVKLLNLPNFETLFLMFQATRPYKVYTAILNQIDEENPFPSVFQDSFGDLNFGRTSEGSYYIESASTLFTEFNTWITFNDQNNPNGQIQMFPSFNNIIQIYTSQNGIGRDNKISNLSIEIRVYNNNIDQRSDQV